MKRYRNFKKVMLMLILAVMTAGLLLPGCGKKNEPSVGVIGGADGPTSIYIAPGAAAQQEAVPDLVLVKDETAPASGPSETPDAEASEAEAPAVQGAPEAAAEPSQEQAQEQPAGPESAIDEGGIYTSKDDVALYIHTYGKLPQNFITKKEAQSLGWPGGSLEPYAPGKCIGGDYFGNYEGKLPKNTKYNECDIDTLGKKSRGAKRIIYSRDGKIYYTGDHYETYEQLY